MKLLSKIKSVNKRILKKIRLRTWIALIVITILLPIATFRFIYQIIAAPPVASATWKMDEGSGTTIGDSSGNSNAGTLTNAAWKGKELCLSENCLFFDGTGDLVSRADDADFDFANADSFTFSVWFRHGVMSAGTQVLIAKHNATAGGYKIIMEADGDITCGFDDDSTYGPEDSVTSTAANYDDNKWHHMACVKNAGSSLTLYIDSASVGTPDSSFTATGTLANADTFYLGMDGDGSSNDYTGFLDEFRMYREALDASEILVEYNQGSAVRFVPQDSDFLSENLIGYWDLDEESGTAADSSGTVTTLTNVSTTAYTAAKYGNGIEPDGAADYLHAADNATLSVTGSLTLAAWIEPDDVSGTENIIAKWDGSNESYRLTKEAANVRMYIDSDSNYQASTGSPLSANTKTHVVGVYNAVTATVTLFVNGEIVASSTTGTIPSSIGDDAGQFHLAAEDHNNTPKNFFDGHIDEARVYNRDFTPVEVKQLYNWSPGPIGHWKLDENTGTTVIDGSGNGNSGTLYANTSFGLGKYGGAAKFDGDITADDTHIALNTNDTFDGNTQGTICTWVKPYDTGDANQNFISVAEDDDGTHTDSLNLGFSSSSNAFFIVVDNGNTLALIAGPNDSISANQWYHYCVTMAPSGSKFYINGNQSSATYSIGTASTDIWIDDIDENTTGTTFGCLDADISTIATCSSFTEMFEGELDDIRFYNYARNTQQIIEDMNAGHPAGGSPIGTQNIYWKFDTGFGTTAYNEVDTNTDGTLTSMASPATSTSGWTADGRINKGLVFDGSDDKVVIATASDSFVDFNGSEAFSLSAWIYPTTVPTSTTDEDLIIGKWDETSSLRSYRMVLENDDTDATGHIRVEAFDESADAMIGAVSTNDSISENTWYHITMTFSGCTSSCPNTSMKVYINGIDRSTADSSGTFAGIEDLGSDFTVGDYDATDSDGDLDAFTGRIDEVQVYASELTADQVKVVANAGSNASLGGVLATTTEAAQMTDGTGNPPIAWLSFDENTGTTANDRSDNGRTGTLTNTPKWYPGKLGSGIYVAGNDNKEHVALPANTFNSVSTGTIQMWFKASDVGDADQVIFGGSESASAGLWEIDYNVSTNSVYLFSNAGGCNLQMGVVLSNPTSWNHVAITMGTSGNQMFVNGVKQAPSYVTGTAATDCFLDNLSLAGTERYKLGCSPQGGADTCDDGFKYDGLFDEFKVYDYIRTASQIAYDYSRGSPAAWYKMDDCTGTTVNDLSYTADSGTAIDGTWSGAGGSNTSAGTCTVVDATTAWYNGRNGKFNSSLDFDGTDDIVTITNTDTVDLNAGLSTGFTLSTWVYPNSDGESDTGQIFNKGADTYCRTDTESASRVDIECRLDLTTDAAFNISSAIPINQWSHIAFSWTNDADDEVTIWINGVANTSSATFAGDAAADANNLLIGGTPNFDGQIDDFRVFSYELSLAQIRNVMNNGSGVRFGPVTGTP